MSGQQPTAAQQREYLARVRQEMQQQFVQDLMHKITDNCFKTCTGKRGEGLDSSESNCVSNCMDRYMDTMGVVNQALMSRQSRQR
jgi:import inner membrane translocase subunit TIM13